MIFTAVKRVFTNLVIYTISASLSALPYYGAARAETSAELLDAAQQAQETAKDAVSDVAATAQSLGSDTEFLTSSSSNTISAEQLAELQDLYKDAEAVAKAGTQYKSDLYSRSLTEQSSDMEALAYDVIKDVGQIQTTAIESTDSMFDKTKEILGSVDEIAQVYSDCTYSQDFFKSENIVHIPVYEQCTQVIDHSGSCELTHNYSIGALDQVDSSWGDVNLTSDGDNQQIMWIGKVGDNYWSGDCTLFEHYTKVKIVNPKAIKKAVIEYVKYDDYMQIWLGEDEELTKVWQGPYEDRFPYIDPDTGEKVGSGTCELNTSWEENLSIDVTDYFTSAAEGRTLTFKIRASVTGNGEAYARMRIWTDPLYMVTNDSWEDAACLAMAQAVAEGSATGSVVCTSMPTVDTVGCMTYQGVEVCSSSFADPNLGISPLCKKAAVVANYDFYTGAMECFTDINGEEQCWENEGGYLDTCQELVDSGCGYIKGECVEGAEGKFNSCFVYTNTYDCGYDQIVPTTTAETEVSCDGELACLGTECTEINSSISTDFAYIAALLNVAQEMGKDMTCSGVDDDGLITGEDAVECSVFKGESSECKVAVGGIQDCCEKPKGISVIDYIILIYEVYKADSAVMALEVTESTFGGSIISAYQGLHNDVAGILSNGLSEVTKPFVSYVDNIAGNISSITQPITDLVSELTSALQEKVTFLMSEVASKMGISVGGEAAAGAAAEEASSASETISSALGSASSVLSVVGTVYASYVVAMMVIQMVWKCSDSEFQLNANRALSQCTYVGSYCKTSFVGCIDKRQVYCCYKSPLARIIQEQAALQLGSNLGTAKHPNCEGLSLEDVGRIDWDQVDLSEWIGLMAETELYEDESLTMEALTGEGSALDTDGSRLSATERAEERLEGVDADAINDAFVESEMVDYTGEGDYGK